ncbi:MAG: flagellar protein FlgN [Hyphomicrobiales bacterium]
MKRAVIEALGPASPRESLLIGVIDRLLQVVAAETQALRELRPVDTTPFAVQKSQALLEFARLARQGDLGTVGDVVRERLLLLSTALDDNRAALDLHLRASREVFETVTRALNDAESDRTYRAIPTKPVGKA